MILTSDFKNIDTGTTFGIDKMNYVNATDAPAQQLLSTYYCEDPLTDNFWSKLLIENEDDGVIRVPFVHPDIQSAIREIRNRVDQMSLINKSTFYEDRIEHTEENGDSINLILLIINVPELDRESRFKLQENLLDFITFHDSPIVRNILAVSVRN